MNALNCLAWCHQVRGAFPQDLRTAIHVREWLAYSAESAALTDEDHAAVVDARVAAALVEGA